MNSKILNESGKEQDMEKNVTIKPAAEAENIPQYGKIRKPVRKNVEQPKILINDRKKASYDLYSLGKKPQE